MESKLKPELLRKLKSKALNNCIYEFNKLYEKKPTISIGSIDITDIIESSAKYCENHGCWSSFNISFESIGYAYKIGFIKGRRDAIREIRKRNQSLSKI